MISCCDDLKRDDLRQVSFFNSWEDVQKQVVRAQSDSLQKLSHQEFLMLTSSLHHLWDFTDFISNQIVPKLDTSIFWGLVVLSIKVASDPPWGFHALRLTLRTSLLKTKKAP